MGAPATAQPQLKPSAQREPEGTLEFVSEAIHRPVGADLMRNYFWAGLLGVFVLSEMLGSLIGWPTVTGRIYTVFRVAAIPARDGHGILGWMIATLLPQLAVTIVAGRLIAKTTWLIALHGVWRRVVLKHNVVLPEARLLQAVLGVIAGIIVSVLVSTFVGSVPPSRQRLIDGEAICLGLCILVTIAYIALRPKVQFHVNRDEGRIVRFLRPCPHPVEITLSSPPFIKTVALRRIGTDYEWCDATAPLRLDRGELLLLNLSVMEHKINAPVTITSRKAFTCAGRFGLDLVRPPRSGFVAPFDADAVGLMIDNLYEREDLEHFLQERLSLALNDYAKTADAELATIENDFRLDILRDYDTSSGETMTSERPRVSGFGSGQIASDRLALTRTRIGARIAKLEDYRSRFKAIHTSHLSAKDALPQRFNQGLLDFLESRIGGGAAFVPPPVVNAVRQPATDEPAQSIERLFTITNVAFRLDSFDFSEKARGAESLVESEIDKAHQELAAAEENVRTIQHDAQKELRAMIIKMIGDMTPQMLQTQKGKLFAGQLMALLADPSGISEGKFREATATFQGGTVEAESDALPPPT